VGHGNTTHFHGPQNIEPSHAICPLQRNLQYNTIQTGSLQLTGTTFNSGITYILSMLNDKNRIKALCTFAHNI